MPLRTGPFPAVALTVAGLLLTGCAGDPGDTAPAAANRSTREAAKSGPNARSGAEGQLVRAQVIPALGPGTSAKITAANKQAVVVVGDDPDSNKSVATLYERDPVLGWKPVSEPWPAHNALLGWTEDHHTADHRSPIGVFGLTDAGGMLPNPGTKLPYDEGPAFDAPGTGFEGEPLEGSFDYVVAINYNREPGNSPLDWTRPLGMEKGGGIWIHVDHGGPTQGCVALPRARMKELLRWLDPAKQPVVVMGDLTGLGR
ncbi:MULTISPECIES: L,D-transpeptidase family protein [unclassified Streptomyces]|uniref:L,D-transpeptidase family protein n=1 Tax=unclassified Streptomyces TaxID=2593676 RepID=UPI002DD99386|nr:L,D-transpeptidase family protein [Streptomyces sp. NBC_01750]WSB01531.1 L,D-transpeptidase family protein [Streptomyces sp. NBC_01794]WSD34140.1 L,D-transpeptidase family protein [Streptomyces sp. NBC_01750]